MSVCLYVCLSVGLSHIFFETLIFCNVYILQIYLKLTFWQIKNQIVVNQDLNKTNTPFEKNGQKNQDLNKNKYDFGKKMSKIFLFFLIQKILYNNISYRIWGLKKCDLVIYIPTYLLTLYLLTYGQSDS